MDSYQHTLASLFDQLGLDSSMDGIESFLAKNSPVPNHIELHQADFWNESQAAFLKEGIEQDADWAELIDQLNLALS